MRSAVFYSKRWYLFVILLYIDLRLFEKGFLPNHSVRSRVVKHSSYVSVYMLCGGRFCKG